MELRVFESDPFKVFGELIGQQLAIKVQYRGREIHAKIGPPPTIVLPNIEGAKKETIEVMFGLCLHEAGHLRFSKFEVIAQIKDYLTKTLHNMLEDEYMERMLERDFPGARDMLVYSYKNTHEIVIEGQPLLLPDLSKPFVTIETVQTFDDTDIPTGTALTYSLAPEFKAEVEKYMNLKIDEAMRVHKLNPEDARERDLFIEEHGFNPKDESRYILVAKRMELDRVMRLWFMEARQYPLPLHDWKQHPWREVFLKHTCIKARSSQATLDQAKAIIEELGLTPVLPNDNRPVEEAERLLDEADDKAKEASKARGKVAEKRREISQEIAEKVEELAEAGPLADAEDAEAEAREQAQEASRVLRKAKEELKKARDLEKETRQRLAAERKRIRELRKELRNAEGEDKERIQQALDAVEKRSQETEQKLEERIKKTEEIKADVEAKQQVSSEKRDVVMKATEKRIQAKRDYSDAVEAVSEEVRNAHRKELNELEETAGNAEAEAEQAIEDANTVLEQIKAMDSVVEAMIAPGVVEHVLGVTFDENRNEPMSGDLPPDMVTLQDHNRTGETETYYIGDQVRKYVPYCRDYDEVHRVQETGEGLAEYDKCKQEYARIIAETTEKLSRLYSPELCRVVLNQEEGRLDPRWAYKVGMALRGADVDVSSIRKNVEPLPDPKVAVQLIMDCSGSLDTNVSPNGKTLFHLATSAACCLSEVMTNLSIPHEVIGHTTAPERMSAMEIDEADLPHFSRFVPFQGYLYKSFEEENAARSVFTKVAHWDNVDGEAILWGVSRLAARQERTKLCIVISDGVPYSAMSSPSELQRHLYTVNKTVEAQESEGLFLFGLGICSEAVKHFYKNNSVLSDIDDLPKSVLGVVEHILCNIVGTLG
jgi:cobalamin biosynthesis protein CobT